MKKLSELEIIRNTLNDIIESGKVRSFDIEENTIKANSHVDYLSTHNDRVSSIVEFIKQKLAFRESVRTEERVNSLDRLELFYQFDVIQCSGVRGSGSTSAIAELFDTERDIYIGQNHGTIKEFNRIIYNKYKDVDGKRDRASYINFNTVTHTNDDFSEDMKRRLKDYLKTVQMVKIDKSDEYDNYTSKIIRSDDIINALALNGGVVYGCPSMRGKSVYNQAKIFIDLDVQTQMRYSVKLNKLVMEIMMINAMYKDCVFIYM